MRHVLMVSGRDIHGAFMWHLCGIHVGIHWAFIIEHSWDIHMNCIWHSLGIHEWVFIGHIWGIRGTFMGHSCGHSLGIHCRTFM